MIADPPRNFQSVSKTTRVRIQCSTRSGVEVTLYVECNKEVGGVLPRVRRRGLLSSMCWFLSTVNRQEDSKSQDMNKGQEQRVGCAKNIQGEGRTSHRKR